MQSPKAWAWIAALSDVVSVAWLTAMVASQLRVYAAPELQLDGALVVSLAFFGVLFTAIAWVLLLAFSRRFTTYVGLGLMVVLLGLTLLGLVAAFEGLAGLANTLPFMCSHFFTRVCVFLGAANHAYKAVGIPCSNADDGFGLRLNRL